MACGPGLNDLSLGSLPLLVVNAQVDADAVSARATSKRLRASVVWGAVPPEQIACLMDPDNEELQIGCHDPFAVFPGQVEPSVAVPMDGSVFEIPLLRLPGGEVAIGNGEGLISHGSLVVFEDVDANGTLDLAQAGSPVALDTVLAASFYRQGEPQERLIYREGVFDDRSYFYPIPQPLCATPPKGFSILRLGDVSRPAPPVDRCVLGDVSGPLRVTPLTAAQAQPMECLRPWPPGITPIGEVDFDPGGRGAEDNPDKPGHGSPGDPEGGVCVGKDILAIIAPGHCPFIDILALRGCYESFYCAEPQWDSTDDPPAWWPCE